MDVKFFRFMSQEKMYENASYSRNIVPTPPNIARDMLDLMPDDFWRNKDAKVLNLACKDGNFLYRVCELFMEGLKGEIPNEQERLDHIINNCLYACICRDTNIQDRWLGLIDIKKIYSLGCFLDLPESNIFVVDYNKQGLKFYSSNTEKELIEMPKFDLVIGNPPYNSDLYLDFVLQAQELSKDKVVMITPAKWQAETTSKTKSIKNSILQYASKLVYYPECKDVFDIHMDGGISYFILNKEVSSSIMIGMCKGNVYRECNMCVSDVDMLDLDANSIFKKVKCSGTFNSIVSSSNSVCIPKKSYFCSLQPTEIKEGTGDFYLTNKNNRVRLSNSDVKHLDEVCNYKVYCIHVNANPVIHILDKFEVYGRSACLLGFGDLAFCESIKSYYACKLIWYLAYIGNSGNINTNTFRFVPEPDAFDHIFTDEELYTRYNLTSEEIDLIESVIKSRTK